MYLLFLLMEGRASWFIDNLTSAPADFDALKLALIKKFKTQNKMKKSQ